MQAFTFYASDDKLDNRGNTAGSKYRYAFKRYDKFDLNTSTSCFSESIGPNITPAVVQFHEIFISKINNKFIIVIQISSKNFVKPEFQTKKLVTDRDLPRFNILNFFAYIVAVEST